LDWRSPVLSAFSVIITLNINQNKL